MAIEPNFEEFAAGYEANRNQIVYSRLASDLDTPVSMMLKLADADDFSFMLESVTGGEVRGRYSIVGMDPDLIWECNGKTARTNRNPVDGKDEWHEEWGTPFESLRRLIESTRIELPSNLPSSSAGLFGYLGYDMVRLVEHLPNVNEDRMGTPDAVLIRPSVVAVLDGIKGEATIVSPAWLDSGMNARQAYDAACSRLVRAMQQLDKLPLQQVREFGEAVPPPQAEVGISQSDYIALVKRAKDYIRAGDIFQVVPSQRWRQEFRLPPFAFYRALRRTNPSPFMFFFNFGSFQVIGASPEILVRVFGQEITIRPIAGTRRRGATQKEDEALAKELLADKKELAEHLMLLDLGRNDVGRVSKIGSVHPTEQFVIERYSHVMHIVSNVVGKLSDEHDALSALLAGLPAGTVSGAPKVRAMEIIDELEQEKRGIYGGGVGYFSSNGDMDMCIALRTAVLKDGVLHIQAGGGIVHDSDPEAEWLESIHKSDALRKAAADAGMFVG